MNTLIADDYINNNHLVSTLTDSAQHMPDKKLLFEYYCSPVYQQSIELLASNVADRTFAYGRFAEGLSCFPAAFSSFIRKFLDSFNKADQCAQYVDDIGVAAKTPQQLINNLRTVFQRLAKAGPKLHTAECFFGVKDVDFLWRTITNKRLAPQNQKIAKLLKNGKFPRSKNALQHIVGFLNYYPNYIPGLAETLTGFFQILKTTDTKAKILINPHIMKDFKETKEVSRICCQLAPRQPLPGEQLFLMTDASFEAAGYAVLIDDDLNQK